MMHVLSNSSMQQPTNARQAGVELWAQRGTSPSLQYQRHLPRQQLLQKLLAEVISHAVALQVSYLSNADGQRRLCLPPLDAVYVLDAD